MFSGSYNLKLIKTKCVTLNNGLLTFFEEVKTVPKEFFSNNHQITHIQLSNIEVIEDHAFRGLDQLKCVQGLYLIRIQNAASFRAKT